MEKMIFVEHSEFKLVVYLNCLFLIMFFITLMFESFRNLFFIKYPNLEKLLIISTGLSILFVFVWIFLCGAYMAYNFINFFATFEKQTQTIIFLSIILFIVFMSILWILVGKSRLQLIQDLKKEKLEHQKTIDLFKKEINRLEKENDILQNYLQK